MLTPPEMAAMFTLLSDGLSKKLNVSALGLTPLMVPTEFGTHDDVSIGPRHCIWLTVVCPVTFKLEKTRDDGKQDMSIGVAHDVMVGTHV